MTEMLYRFFDFKLYSVIVRLFVGLRDKFGIYKIRLKIDGKCRIW